MSNEIVWNDFKLIKPEFKVMGNDNRFDEANKYLVNTSEAIDVAWMTYQGYFIDHNGGAKIVDNWSELPDLPVAEEDMLQCDISLPEFRSDQIADSEFCSDQIAEGEFCSSCHEATVGDE